MQEYTIPDLPVIPTRELEYLGRWVDHDDPPWPCSLLLPSPLGDLPRPWASDGLGLVVGGDERGERTSSGSSGSRPASALRCESVFDHRMLRWR